MSKNIQNDTYNAYGSKIDISGYQAVSSQGIRVKNISLVEALQWNVIDFQNLIPAIMTPNHILIKNPIVNH